MDHYIFEEGDVRNFVIGTVTKNWGGNTWDVLSEKEITSRIWAIRRVVDILLAKDENPKLKIEK